MGIKVDHWDLFDDKWLCLVIVYNLPSVLAINTWLVKARGPFEKCSETLIGWSSYWRWWCIPSWSLNSWISYLALAQDINSYHDNIISSVISRTQSNQSSSAPLWRQNFEKVL